MINNRTHPPSSAGVIGKAAQLLQTLAEHDELTAAELAKAIAEPRSSVYRLLKSLRDTGLVEPGYQRGTHRLGLTLLRLGSTVAERLDVANVSRGVMQSIHDETEQTLFLCVRRDDEAVCVARIDGRHVQSSFLRLGESLPLHIGAGPRTLLAYEPREAWDEYLDRAPLSALTADTPIDAPQIVDRLERIRHEGVAVSDGDVILGIAALGAPVFDHAGAIVASLSISGTRPAILGDDAERLRANLVEGAAEISSRLGYELPAAHTPDAEQHRQPDGEESSDAPR